MNHQYIKKILTARVYDVAEKTPLDFAPNLSERIGNRVFLKREDLQPVFSFKLRGAYNKISQLPQEILERGVITASAGNHAQGVALAAQKMGIKSIIVMPRTTPSIKVDAVRKLGGRVVLHGDNYDEACERALVMADERGMTFIHPYDDPDVIAGQGTVAMEILQQHGEPLHAIFVPVGGGGLIAGMAAYVKYVCPETKIIAVEPEDAPTLHAALAAGRRVKLGQVGLFADGVAVKQIGKETFRIARELVDDTVLVSTDEICAAIRDIYEDTRSVAEPAGALAVAGMKRYAARHKLDGQALAAVVSGANMNFDRLRYIAERTELGQHREALLAVTLPERPGSFRRFCRDIGKRVITEFNYRYADSQEANVFAGIKLQEGVQEKEALVAHLRDKGYVVADLTDNEMAKAHVRYMVGGRAPLATDEMVMRVEFPERPGALSQFLDSLGSTWNISLFHYRNHGADYGRVLMGLQVPVGERAHYLKWLENTGYAFAEDTDNLAYRFFLGVDTKGS